MNRPPTRVRSSAPALAGACVMLCAVAPGARAQDEAVLPGVPGVLIDSAMRSVPVRLLGVENGQVAYLDARGSRRSDAASAWLGFVAGAAGTERAGTPAGADGVLPADAPSPDSSLGSLELVDGQRFPGRPRAGGPGADGDGGGQSAAAAFEWSDPTAGVISPALDRLSRICVDPRGADDARAAGEATEDTVVLANGDRLVGFADSLSGSGLRFEVSGQARDISWGRIAAAMFSNPAAAPTGIVLWRRDGGVAVVRNVAPAPATDGAAEPEFAVVLDVRPQPAASIGATEVFALLFDPARLTPLRSAPISSQRPLGGRRWTAPASWSDPRLAVFGASDLSIPGPMEVRWEVGAGPARFSALAELPEAMWTWGDCEVIASVEPGGEVFRTHLCEQTPRQAINVALPEAGRARVLSIRVEPGVYGAVQDRVVLRRPVLVK